MKLFYLLPLLFATSALAEIPTPARPVTDPRSLMSPGDPQAAPVPIDDLVFTRGALDATWSADASQLFVSTNLTGRYNIWRMDSDGSWPVQLDSVRGQPIGLRRVAGRANALLPPGQGRERAIRHLCRPDGGRRSEEFDEHSGPARILASHGARRPSDGAVDEAQRARADRHRRDGHEQRRGSGPNS